MPLVVIGTIAFDSIKTPSGQVEDALGGSAVHFSLAAAMLCPTRLVGVVGEDFPDQYLEDLRDRGVDVSGVERIAGQRTFRWSCEYLEDMNQRETLSVELNVFGSHQPKLGEAQRQAKFVFLANGHPRIQTDFLNQLDAESAFVMADTMDLWIHTTHSELEGLLRRVDGLVLNDQEAYLLAGEHNLIRAGRRICDYGLRYLIVKKGEHGCIIFHEGNEYSLPAVPLADVIDPTGAGDTFAGGVMGHLARQGDLGLATFKKAVAWGTVLASFCCEDYDVRRLRRLATEKAEKRFTRYCDMLRLDGE